MATNSKKPEPPKADTPTAQTPDASQTQKDLGMALGGLLAPMLVAANGGNKCELPNINIWVFCNGK